MGKRWISRIKEHEQIYGNLLRLEYAYCRLFHTDDEKYIRRVFRKRMGREPELVNPVEFADKVQWLKLYWRNPLAAICADKYAVREYVVEKIGVQYLNELYGIYGSAEEIDLAKLPKSFILKTNHGSGWNVLCPDKSRMDWKSEKKKLNRWLGMNYYDKWREWVYKDMEPRILCEKYMGGPEELMDYKFHCFKGEPMTVSACFHREGKSYINSYNLDWERLPVIKMVDTLDVELEKPACLEEMREVCRRLAAPFPYVRMDLYQVDNKVIFGEMTFFPASGIVDLKPKEYNRIYGDYIDLSLIENQMEG
jgi:hypothetical protein